MEPKGDCWSAPGRSPRVERTNDESLLREAGLPAALCAYCEEFSKIRGITVSCETNESVKDLSPVPRCVSTASLGSTRQCRQTLGSKECRGSLDSVRSQGLPNGKGFTSTIRVALSETDRTTMTKRPAQRSIGPWKRVLWFIPVSRAISTRSGHRLLNESRPIPPVFPEIRFRWFSLLDK